MKKSILLLTISVAISFAQAQKPPKTNRNYIPSDTASFSGGPLPYNYKANLKYKKVESTSMYLAMRDSVKIAVNVTLPKGLPDGEKIPAVLYQTRYWRGAKFRWPFSMFINNFSGKQGKMITDVIKCGYAFIAADSRGSGASFGTRKHPWSHDEVRDMYEIVDWIVKQPWCNGNVGGAGVSYSGTTAEFLATTGHPAVKAVAPMFSLYDVYDDISLPGGVQLEYFSRNWGEANWKLDNNKLPIGGIAKLVVKGVQPVKGHKKMVKMAVKDHQANLNVNDGVKSITYRDDISKADNYTSPDSFSPHFYSKKIDNAGVVVYSISGYFDGDYQHAAIKRFRTLQHPENKLLLGPWEHGGSMNCSHFNPGESGFDKTAEILKFFDHYLKGMDTGIEKEPRVNYFTLGEERWKSSSGWPPENSYYHSFYLEGDGKLASRNPSLTANISSSHTPPSFSGFTAYQADTTFGSGSKSRWRSLLSQLNIPFPYYDWTTRSAQLIHFATEPLEQDMEVTGHPVMALYVASSDTDGAFHVYLEDVDEQGKVSYVTEGLLRALHRKVSHEPRPYKDVENIPYHSYLKKDGAPLAPQKTEMITFDLLPVSYLFKKGHRIRISIAGADRDHFKILNPDARWQIQHHGEFASFIALPLIE